jgi:hypothetical protein
MLINVIFLIALGLTSPNADPTGTGTAAQGPVKPPPPPPPPPCRCVDMPFKSW